MKCNCQNGCGEMKGLAHIGVYTSNMEESIRFYTEVLGFKLNYTKDMPKPQGVTKLAFVQIGSCVIELIQPANGNEVEGRSAGIVDHIAIEVDDIEKLVCRLLDHNVPFETEDIINMPQLFDGAKAIFFKGPGGERLEFFEYVK